MRMVAASILVVLGCLYSVISNIAHVKVKAWPWSTPTDVYPVPPPRSAAAQTVDATLAAVAPPAADFFGGRAKRVWPSCTDGAGEGVEDTSALAKHDLELGAADGSGIRRQGKGSRLCDGPLGGPTSCKGASYIDTTFYGKIVPEKDHVQYVHSDAESKFDYGAGEKMCEARSMDVCTQDQLGAAWYLGYENGCRGFVSDKWAVGMPPAALHVLEDRRGHRISVAPSGIMLSKAGTLRIGMNGRFEKDEAVVGTYCCSRTDLNEGQTRPCDQQMGQVFPQTLTAVYIRWFEHLRKNNGYTALLGGTLIGALRNHSLIPECGERKHETGIVFAPPDIDLTTPMEAGPFYGGEKFDYRGFWNDLDNDPFLVGLKSVNTCTTHYSEMAKYEVPDCNWEGYDKSDPGAGKHNFALDTVAGFLFPRMISSDPPDISGTSLYIEMWEYFKTDDTAEGRSVYKYDPGDSQICGEAFNISTLQKVDLSIGSLPAYGYVFQGSEEYLDAIYGAWRNKVDKNAYAPGQGKGADWNSAQLLDVCQNAFDTDRPTRRHQLAGASGSVSRAK